MSEMHPETPEDLPPAQDAAADEGHPAGHSPSHKGTNVRARVDEFRKQTASTLLSMVFTDLVASTRLKQQRGDREAVALIQTHKDIMRDTLAEFPDAKEINFSGDSFFLAFLKPSDAVAFCLKVQAAHRTEFPDREIVVRMGVHLGEVLVGENAGDRDYYGLQVDTAARVMCLAMGGQILLTKAVFDNARQFLMEREVEYLAPLVWLNHGLYEFKGVDAPQEICEVGESGLGALGAPEGSAKARPVAGSEEETGWRPGPEIVIPPKTPWKLLRQLGKGGFGEVWLAEHVHTLEKRVFKFCFHRERLRSLRMELEILRRIRETFGDHPNIVRLYEVFLDEPPYYLGMEYVPGPDLRGWLEGSRAGAEAAERSSRLAKIATEVKLDIVIQVAEALDAAHKTGVIHQDVKPENILIFEKPDAPEAPPVLHAKLSDFGVGRVVQAAAIKRATSFRSSIRGTTTAGAGSTSGTILYMAPERREGSKATPQSDIYSLGVVLFQMMAGNLKRDVTLEWEQEVRDSVIRDILRRMLAGKPELRFASAAEAASALRAWKKRRLLRWSAPALLACAAAAGAAWLAFQPGSGAPVPAVPEVRATTPRPVPSVPAKSVSRAAPRKKEPTTPPAKVGIDLITWVSIPGGTFMMGTKGTKNVNAVIKAGAILTGLALLRVQTGGDELPRHPVSVKPFQMAKQEVTFAQYEECVKAGGCTPAHASDGTCEVYDGSHRRPGTLPPRLLGDSQPAVCVTWEQARAFCAWVGGRLPTEAEWEYAARNAGGELRYPWGDKAASCGQAVMGEGGLGCGRDATGPVCSRPDGSTAQGLCDMAGNVWEWVQDSYRYSYKGAPSDGSAWQGTAGAEKTIRGGSWFDDGGELRVQARDKRDPQTSDDRLGLRPARSEAGLQ